MDSDRLVERGETETDRQTKDSHRETEMDSDRIAERKAGDKRHKKKATVTQILTEERDRGMKELCF